MQVQLIRLETDKKCLATMLTGFTMFGNSVNQVYAEKWKEQGCERV
jgi:hypothetical protein